jgi:hypothetical protein
MSEKRLVERSEDKAAKHERLSYEAPRAMRLGSVHAGAGLCDPTGSGDAEQCATPGNSASSDGCNWPGSSATGEGCHKPGSSAPGICDPDGSGAPI